MSERFTANLVVHASSSAEAVKMIETLTRVMLGLVLDGFETEMFAGREPDYFEEDTDETVDQETDDNE